MSTDRNNIYKNYNPDILETIANLSNDEVFTPPKLANEVLDLLPEKVWSNPNLTFLDPAVKTGIFLREIASRLIDGLAEEIPDLQERVNHILTKQVFGIGITELTTLMARRTVYCSTTANGPFSIVTEFDNEEGNIIFPDTEHTWNKNGRCEYCGANKDSYDGGANRESYAYPFIHKDFEEVFKDMKFDVIIGNPPYQLDDGGGGTGDSASPLYNKFIDISKNLSPRYISMIIPSRWMNGGRGLNSFREEMLDDKRMKVIHDYENSQEIFPSVGVNGGICYFLWDSNHDDKCRYTFHLKDGTIKENERYLRSDIEGLNKVIRDYEEYPIIKKVNKSSKKFDNIVSSANMYGFRTNLFNNTELYKDVKLQENKGPNSCLVYGIENTRRAKKYINRSAINKNKADIDKYKIFFPAVFGTETTLLPEIITAEPGEISTGSFIQIGSFDNKDTMLNCISYMETKFFRFLFNSNKYSYGMSKRTFSLIPLVDFSKSWTDEELYKKYKLTEEEIAYIEDNIAPMGDQDDLVDPDDSEFEDEDGEEE